MEQVTRLKADIFDLIKRIEGLIAEKNNRLKELAMLEAANQKEDSR